MKFYLRNYANRIKSYTYRNKVLCLIFCKITEPRNNQLNIEIKRIYYKKNIENYFLF